MMESCPAEKRIGIMGGSFDPVHIGHLIIAQDAVERLNLSEVIFIPAAIPPHKQHLQQVDAIHRLNMLRLAVESNRKFSVSDIEVRRGGISYTVDTLNALRASRQDEKLFLIIGSDTLVDLHTWYRTDLLLEMCEIATFVRLGEDSIERIAGKINLPTGQRRRLLQNVIEAHRIEVSSTEIRTRLSQEVGIRYLVPPTVEAYIEKHSLYKG